MLQLSKTRKLEKNFRHSEVALKIKLCSFQTGMKKDKFRDEKINHTADSEETVFNCHFMKANSCH